jgi:hypothetical protein
MLEEIRQIHMSAVDHVEGANVIRCKV